MKKKQLTNTLDNIFSEIDFKETSINETNDIRMYSLDILSDISDSSHSIELDDYDLDTESSKSIDLNTQDFFNCLLDIDNNNNKNKNEYEYDYDNQVDLKNYHNQDNQDNQDHSNLVKNEDNDSFTVSYINELSNLINVDPSNIVINKLSTNHKNTESSSKNSSDKLEKLSEEINHLNKEICEKDIKIDNLSLELDLKDNQIEHLSEKIIKLTQSENIKNNQNIEKTTNNQNTTNNDSTNNQNTTNNDSINNHNTEKTTNNDSINNHNNQKTTNNHNTEKTTNNDSINNHNNQKTTNNHNTEKTTNNDSTNNHNTEKTTNNDSTNNHNTEKTTNNDSINNNDDIKTITTNNNDDIKTITTNNNDDIKTITTNNDYNDNNNNKLQNLDTCEKNNIWKEFKTDNLSSYNYLNTESSQNIDTIESYKFKDFYNIAVNNKKNIKGYINNNYIIHSKQNITYPLEVYTKISNSDEIEPPGNYINMFMNKNLDINKKVYLLCNSGYWILEPLQNYKKLIKQPITKEILHIYFIILKLLYVNKSYPFNSGDNLKKYKNLAKNINFNLIINYINNNKQFKNYIDEQLSNVFNIKSKIDDIINKFYMNNLNKSYTNILKLKYIYY